MRKGFGALIVVVTLSLLLVSFVAFWVFKDNLKISEKQTDTPTIQNDQSSLEYPQLITEKKGLSFNRENHYRDPVKVEFENWENTTYDEAKYRFKNNNYSIYQININSEVIYFRTNKYSAPSTKERIEYIYEGFGLIDDSLLHLELEQKNGVYPKTIYHPEYQIITNKNGVKMKKRYYNMPPTGSAAGIKVEFIAGGEYYVVDAPFVGEFEYRNNTSTTKVTSPEKIKELNAFIETIDVLD